MGTRCCASGTPSFCFFFLNWLYNKLNKLMSGVTLLPFIVPARNRMQSNKRVSSVITPSSGGAKLTLTGRCSWGVRHLNEKRCDVLGSHQESPSKVLLDQKRIYIFHSVQFAFILGFFAAELHFVNKTKQVKVIPPVGRKWWKGNKRGSPARCVSAVHSFAVFRTATPL